MAERKRPTGPAAKKSPSASRSKSSSKPGAKPRAKSASGSPSPKPRSPASQTSGKNPPGRKAGTKNSAAASRSRVVRGAVFTVKWGFISAIWIGLLLGGVVAWYAYDLPDIDSLEAPARRAGITVLDANGGPVASYGDLYGDPLRLADVPPHLVQAIVATEDRRFFEHGGFDPFALLRATVANVRAGRVRQGGSTLTQQLAKNVFLKPDRTLRRKVQELLLAFWLEANFTKEQIFTLYINRVYLGSGTYGVDAAAQRYFSKSARKVDLLEAAVLAGLLKAPSRYSPLRNAKAATSRAHVVLGAMVAAGFLDAKSAATAKGRKLKVAGGPSGGRTSQYFADWVLERVNGFVGRLEGDLIVRTTLDPRLQRIAETQLKATLTRNGRKSSASQAALVSMSPDGAVRALVGGRSYSASQFNRAFQARRQPGSLFKLFVYLAAMENGLTPDSRFVDGPVRIGKWRPRNYGGTYVGTVTLREAMAQSINTVAVQVSEKVGRQKVIDAARRLGVTAPLKAHPSLALGASEISLVELTSAYGVIANGGISVWAHGITEIRERSGRILYRRTDGAAPQVVEPRAVAAVNDLLRAVVAWGTGKAANPGRPAAGKTGTSQDFRDAWFVGYTGELVTGVWMGNDDSSPMKKVTGGGLPARLWRAYTRGALDGRAARPLGPAYTPAAEASPAASRPASRWTPSVRTPDPDDGYNKGD